MSTRKVTLLLFAVLCAASVQAQNIIVGADFATRFDNREYSANEFGTSQTLFSARLTPYVGVQWDEKNRLIAGVELLQNFGEDSKSIKVSTVLYYRFRAQKAAANAGIFQRKELMGDYSPAFFSDSTVFYHNLISGFMGRYHSTERPNTYVEMALDWEGMPTNESREKFRIFGGGRYTTGAGLYFGVAASMFHFAGEVDNRNVTDNMLANPFVGWEFNAFFDFDLRAGFLVAPQRARSVDNEWHTPCGAQIDFRLSRWGVKLMNNLYLGENLQPYYNDISNPTTGATYGQEGLYAGERFYSTTKGIYNRTWIGYDQRFFNGSMSLQAGMVFHYDGTALGTQQVVQLSVDIQKIFGNKNKN